jgi:hypothetical protein
MGDAGNFFKNAAYLGFAALTGFTGYIVGQSKHWQGVSLATIGLALLLYTPRGCEYLEKRAEINGELEKMRIYQDSKKDSLDTMFDIKDAELSKKYLNSTNTKLSELESELRLSYEQLLKNNDAKYERLLRDVNGKNIQYSEALKLINAQNTSLKISLDSLITVYGISAGSDESKNYTDVVELVPTYNTQSNNQSTNQSNNLSTTQSSVSSNAGSNVQLTQSSIRNSGSERNNERKNKQKNETRTAVWFMSDWDKK